MIPDTMTKESGAPSPRRRAASNVTLSCRFSSRSGIQVVLAEVATHLEDGEQLCAFLDDVYLPLFNVLEDSDEDRGNPVTPKRRPGVTDNTVDVWGPEHGKPEGITVLWIPIGGAQYIAEKVEERMSKERLLWVSNSFRFRFSASVANLAAE